MIERFLICVAAACVLFGCLVETFTDGDTGVVYECVGPVDVVELCATIDAERLGRELGRTCHETNRWWPQLTNALGNGCVYSCEPHQGCNARGGCYCPGGMEDDR